MAIKISGNTVIDDSKNICNIANVTACGTITLNGIVYPGSDGTCGQVLKTDGSGNLSFGADAGAVDVCEMTSSGTWTKPSGVSMVFVEIISAGAGGNRGCFYNPPDVPAGSPISGAAGGAGGAYYSFYIPAPSLSSTECVIVGAGGLGACSSTTAGGGGGCSCFNGVLVLGGGGGCTGPGGGGTGPKGHIACTYAGSNPLFDGGGAQCALATGVCPTGICGLNGAGAGGRGCSLVPGRAGGISIFGSSGNGGDGGQSGCLPNNVVPSAFNGSPGCNYGGGGGGGGHVVNPPSYTYSVCGGCGGNGAPGVVRITSW